MPKKTKTDKEFLGVLLALIAAVISGFAIPINKVFVVGIDPAVFTAVRALIIGVVFLVLSLLQANFSGGKKGRGKKGGLKDFKTVPWKYLLIIGFIGGGLAFLMFFTGLGLTTAGRAAFMHKLLPVFAGIFAYLFLKEKIPKEHAFALFVMVIGAFMIFSAGISPTSFWSNPGLGDAIIIIATILWAAENVIAKKAMIKGESSFVVSFARMFFGGLLLFGVIILLGKFDVLLALSSQQAVNIMISTGVLFGYVLFWYAAIRFINVSKAAAMLLIAPVISLMAGVYWLAEPLPLLQLMGSVLILAGAYFVIRIRSEFSTGV